VVAAQFIVGLGHLEGYSIERNERFAYYWLRMAEENSAAIALRTRALLEKLRSSLKTDDIEAVEQMVTIWVQENKLLRSKRPAEFIRTSPDPGPLQQQSFPLSDVPQELDQLISPAMGSPNFRYPARYAFCMAFQPIPLSRNYALFRTSAVEESRVNINCQIEHGASDSDVGTPCSNPAVATCADCGAAICSDCRRWCCRESFYQGVAIPA
jgi:hypothetical protein